MDTLPNRIPVIDDTWKSLGAKATWQRVDEKDRTVLEEHIDGLVCAHADAIAESLQGAGVLEEETKLLVLGTQVDNVDVVLAEVDAGDDAFRRLVLVESKLFRNPQAKRSVLAQVIEYGHVAQRTWPTKPLPTLFKKAERAWLERNAADISESLRRGEYLLLLVGDRIDRNLTMLARRFAAQESPLNLSELAVLSVALYRRGDERLVLPHVVSAVTVGERTLTIQVKVENAASQELKASVTARTDMPLRSKEEGAPEGAPQFLVDVARLLNPEMEADGWAMTKRPRKLLGYYAEYDDAAAEGSNGTRLSCVAHFGGWAPEWRPLLVGVDVTARSTADRDRFRKAFEDKIAKSLLPPQAQVTLGGPVTVRALVPIDWEQPADLNTGMADRAVAAFRKMRDELVPVVYDAAEGGETTS
jgi:hypothetical protein